MANPERQKHDDTAIKDQAIADRQATLLELAQRQGVKPLRSSEDLRVGLFESDEEVDDFIAYVRRNRDADLV